MKKLITVAVLLVFPLILFAQKYAIRDFEAEIQDSILIVKFKFFTKATIDLGMFYKIDSASKWKLCSTISGDIENQTYGNKTIFWDYLQDGVPGEELYNNKLLFRILEVEPYAYQRELEEKRLQKQKRIEERAIAREKAKADAQIANENPNGHYIGLGTSLTSSGYYGELFGLSYEYRHQLYGVNVSVGYGYGGTNLWDYQPSINVNVGLKLYLSHKKKVLRNIYFNFLPVCYFGQEEKHFFYHVVGEDNNILCVTEHKYTHLFGAGIFVGYSPVWHVNKKVALGFNMDLGVKTNYKFNKWCPLNWDLGLVIKF
jgi:hypothetical protein